MPTETPQSSEPGWLVTLSKGLCSMEAGGEGKVAGRAPRRPPRPAQLSLPQMEACYSTGTGNSGTGIIPRWERKETQPQTGIGQQEPSG